MFFKYRGQEPEKKPLAVVVWAGRASPVDAAQSANTRAYIHIYRLLQLNLVDLELRT